MNLDKRLRRLEKALQREFEAPEFHISFIRKASDDIKQVAATLILYPDGTQSSSTPQSPTPISGSRQQWPGQDPAVSRSASGRAPQAE
jgi:hypothetical protein